LDSKNLELSVNLVGEGKIKIPKPEIPR